MTRVTGKLPPTAIRSSKHLTWTSFWAFDVRDFQFVGSGFLLGLPFPIILVVFTGALTYLLTRRTGLGLFIEAIGANSVVDRSLKLQREHYRDATIDSLTGSPDSETSGLPMVNFELAWTFATSRSRPTATLARP